MSYRTQTLFWQRISSYALISIIAFQNTARAEVSGGIVTDGTMGDALILTGANIIVPQSLGATVGNNLFHSFSEFNIASGQSVEFTGSNALQHVISRVTGTDVAEIEGVLKSGIANAAFYFINPNGITFGPGAQVDVPGDFHVSTADKIDFPNTGVFYAGSNRTSTLSSEAPVTFGFLGTSAANNGLIDVNASRLDVRKGQALDMVAGGITIENNAVVVAPAGIVRLVAAQGQESVSLDDQLPLPAELPSVANAGHIAIKAGAVDATGAGGGRIALWGGNTSFKDSMVQVYNIGAANAALAQGVDMRSHSLTVDKSLVAVDALGAGKAGNVAVKAGTLDILNGGAIRSSTFAQGDAGNVTVTAGTLSIDNQGKSVVSGIVSRAEPRSRGQAGNVTIQVGTFDILNGGVVSSSTFAEGNAGNVTVTADALNIDDQADSPVVTGIVSRAEQGSSGRGGNLTVKAGTLDILNAAVVSSSTAAEGDAGSVTVTAGKLNILNGGVFSSSTFAEGNAGNVAVMADTLTIDSLDNSSGSATGIVSRANMGSSGHAGDVTVRAEALNILNGGLVSSDTFAKGKAGSVMVTAGKAAVRGESYISSGSWGTASSGSTGDVTVNANDWLHLDNGGRISIENEASVSAMNAVSIDPGIITVRVPDIDMKDSEITTNSTNNIAAGKIVMNFSHWLNMDSSFITTTANIGNGGTIDIDGGELIHLQNAGFKTTVSGANSNGGDILTTARMLVMDTGLIQANAVGGSGGDITLSLDTLLPSGNTLLLGGKTIVWQPFVPGFNVIQAASQAGVSGTVSVTAPQLNLSGILANLGGPQFDTSIISQDYCELGAGSSLTRKGAGGLMPKSGDQLQF